MENNFLDTFSISIITNTIGFVYMYILIDSWKIWGKKRNAAIIIYILISMIVDGMFFYFVGTTDDIAIGVAFINVLMGLTFLLLVCKFRKGEILFVFFTGIMFVFITNNISNVFAKEGTIELIILKIISDLFFIKVIYKYFRPKFLEFNKTVKSNWYMLSGLPICLCATFTFMVSFNSVLYENIYVKTNCILLSITAIISYTFIYFTMEKVIEREKVLDNQRMMEIELVHVEKYIDGLMIDRQKTSVFNHDLRHYANLIASCVQNEDKQGINEALSHIYKDIDDITASKTKKFCENSTINTIIAYFVDKSQELGIEFFTVLNIENDLEIDKMELAILLSNCIENAINACQKMNSENKKIEVIAKKVGKQLLITVKNTKEGITEFDKEKNIPISKMQGHGIGSKSIKAFVEKYQGQISYDITENIFKIKILI